MTAGDGWEFWIDVGGTFTDCLGRDSGGRIRTHKLLSSGIYKGVVGAGSTRERILCPDRRDDPVGFFDGWKLSILSDDREHRGVLDTVEVSTFDPHQGEFHLVRPFPSEPLPGTRFELTCDAEAPVTGIRWLLGRRLTEDLGHFTVRLGTTRGTNALLERQGARTAFVTTRGFADVLRIAYQNRPRLFDLNIRKPLDLYEQVVEIDERLDAAGIVLVAFDHDKTRDALRAVRGTGVDSLAVCLLNSYRNGDHEKAVAEIARELGFAQVSVSSQLAPIQRIVPRGDTTVVDAYLTPIIADYVNGIRKRLPNARLQMMTSSGGLVEAEKFVGKDSILSGPAGGVVGVAEAARNARFTQAIGFDMGGTSTDVSRWDGEFERRYLMEVNDAQSRTGVRIVAPMLSIETVAAGGGSICWFDGQKIAVGPRSAGSNPGPACYARGGPLTVTDINLFLGKILTDQFAFPLDATVVESRLHTIRDDIAKATGSQYGLEELAQGFTRIANGNMAAAIKKVSIARGYDVRDYVLVSFGGAGAQHACALADELGIRQILLHQYAGILSAFGIGMADVRKFAERHVGKSLNATVLAELAPIVAGLQASLRDAILTEGVADSQIQNGPMRLDLRYRGQDSTISVAKPDDGDFATAFERQHHQLYGFVFEARPVEVVALRVEVIGATVRSAVASQTADSKSLEPHSKTRAYFNDRWYETAVYRRNELAAGSAFDGPAIVVESLSTIVVDPGWTCRMTDTDDLILTANESSMKSANDHNAAASLNVPDPILLELFNNHFASIAEQMGVTLQRTSLSTNVKERLDFSCAVFTANGDLVVNAPHIPVHLGAMGQTVKRLIRDFPTMNPGDAYITNDPFAGGSHLPDVTVVTPVFDNANATLLFFAGSRAHHSEIGGIVPGSMPPFSKSLAEEGVLIRGFRLVHGERSSEDRLRDLLGSGTYPSRSVAENIADINAQVAANQTGVQLLQALVGRFGLELVRAYMKHIRAAAEAKMRKALLKIPIGDHAFEDRLDDGSKIAVRISIAHDSFGGSARVDFTGTGPVAANNLNANPAIVRSAVLYCFRCLIDEDIPLNDGVLAPVEIFVPENCLLNPPAFDDPKKCAAVGGGNVETSQRVVDVIFGALGVVAASQGTMNNFLFGRPASEGKPGFGYYETICGGAGAGPGFPGADAVHTHMTNTRLTDPEVFEDRYPVRLRRFEIARGTGGAGKFKGGSGIVREVEFLDDLDVSLLSNRRITRPYGVNGGEPGKPGQNLLIPNGDEKAAKDLGGSAQLRIAAGDVFRITTPGGGGFGSPD